MRRPGPRSPLCTLSDTPAGPAWARHAPAAPQAGWLAGPNDHPSEHWTATVGRMTIPIIRVWEELRADRERALRGQTTSPCQSRCACAPAQCSPSIPGAARPNHKNLGRRSGDLARYTPSPAAADCSGRSVSSHRLSWQCRLHQPVCVGPAASPRIETRATSESLNVATWTVPVRVRADEDMI